MISVGIVGMGWMGQVHARSYVAALQRFPELATKVELAACSDTDKRLAEQMGKRLGIGRSIVDWHGVVEDDSIDAISVTLPNDHHLEVIRAAAAAGKHIWCEKPMCRSASEAKSAVEAAGQADIATQVGYNYRHVPMVAHLRKLISADLLGEIEIYNGRFFSMYGYDRMSLHGWRFDSARAGAGAAGDVMSHATDMALHLAGPISRVCAQKRTFITARPLPKSGSGTHYATGSAGDPIAAVDNEDYAGALIEFASGAIGTLEGWRTACGPKSDMSFEIYGRLGSARWNFERINELELYLADNPKLDGYTRIVAGGAHGHHAKFNPGDGNPIGLEDTKTIEAADFIRKIIAGKADNSGFKQALAAYDVIDAVLSSSESCEWARVNSS